MLPHFINIRVECNKRKQETERIESSRKMALEDEIERLSQELHDDLETGLTSILVFFELIMLQPDSIDRPNVVQFRKISSVS